MATDILEKRTFPCEPATIEEISDTLWYAAEGKDEYIAALQRSTCLIQLDQIPWSAVRLLGFWGKKKTNCNAKLEKVGLDPGFYISHRGDALVLIHQDDALIQQYVNRCEEDLEILEIHSTSLSSLNVSCLANLREFYAVDNKAFTSLEGLEQLTQLTYLNLCDCRQTPDLSAVCRLPQLTSLLIQHCDKLINFPSLLELTQLKSLTLSGFAEPEILAHLGKLTQLGTLHIASCNNLTALPGLENLTHLTTLELSRCEKLTTLPSLDNLTQLTQLDLSRCNSLTALPSLDNLTQLTSLDLSRCEKLTTLPGLENLTQLTTLQLSQCQNLTILPGLENLTQLTSLDLSQCKKLTTLPGLKKLTQLTSLDLSWCEKLTTLPGLENLTQLTALKASYCRSLTALPGLERLTQLTSLDLSRCEKLTTLPGLENLTQLTALKAPYCRSLTALSGLKNLSRLTSLDLSLCGSLTALPSLNNLKQLTQLDLSGCSSLSVLPSLDSLKQLTFLSLSGWNSLSVLPPLDSLKQLTELDLSGCSSLSVLPPLDNLKQLTELRLFGCKSLTALPPLDSLTKLTRLRLWECSSLTALPPLDSLKQLTELDLSGCSITALPESLRNLKSLRMLDLSDLNLKELPDWLPEIAEKFTLDYNFDEGNKKAIVSLVDTTVEGVDMSIFEQPYEMVVEWFEKRKQGQTQPLNEIKVVFLGDGEAGKSHTIARLMNDGGKPVGYVDVRTPGIVIKNKSFPVGIRDATLHFWDFGGQDIMHSMHRIFLTERTIYVVLVDASIGNQDERARYWLGNIQSFAKDAPVILVLNKLDDDLQADVNAVDLYAKYNGLKRIVKLSAKQYSRERFNAELLNVLLNEIEQTGYLDSQWPDEWIQVKKELEQMEENYIHGAKYMDICQRLNVKKNQKSLLQWFHDLGISFCYCDGENGALEDYVVLKPNWITNALYIILFNEREGGNGGLVPIRTIRTMLGQNAPNKDAIKRVIPDAYYVGYDVNYVLDVFHAFKLSFRKDEYEFFPMLADVNNKPVANDYAKNSDCLEFNMEFDYLPPNNLIHRLMVERSAELDMDNVWRTGARFQLPELGLSAVVVIDGNTLRFFIRHTDPMHKSNTYLAMLKANVDRIIKKMGLKAPECKLVYKIHGKRAVFSYDRLLKMHARGRKEEYCEDLDEDFRIEDILNQSAPAASEDLNTLLDSVISAILHLQGNKNYRGWDENGRNSVVRDSLADKGYIVLDQTLRGTSESGKSYGELDLLIQRVPSRPWVLCEALIAKGYTHKWNEHMDKLLNEYNPHGLSTLFLLTYVDCEKEKFDGIWKKYQKHIQEDDPQKFIRMPNTVEMDLYSEYANIRMARCKYQSSRYSPTVYHIFVQMDPKPE